jgi:hypothetical protein
MSHGVDRRHRNARDISQAASLPLPLRFFFYFLFAVGLYWFAAPVTPRGSTGIDETPSTAPTQNYRTAPEDRRRA